MPRKDKEATKEYSKLWRQRNPIKCRAYNKKWRTNNPEQFRALAKRWREQNPDKVKEYAIANRQNRKEYKILYNYGITFKEKEALLKKQLNVCGICGQDFKNSRDAHLDHNHITKKVRGILCRRCNWALGYFRDNQQILENAVMYLKLHKL